LTIYDDGPPWGIKVVEVKHVVVFGEIAQVVNSEVSVDAGNVVTDVRRVVMSEREVDTLVEVSVGDDSQIVAAMARSEW